MTNKDLPPKGATDISTKPENESRRPRRLILEVNPEEKGMALAIESGITEPLPEHTEMLTGWAEALGDQGWEHRWDPKTKPSDALLAEEHEKNIKERGECEKHIRQRQAEHRDAGDALAGVQAAGEKPTMPLRTKAVVVAVMAFSMSPTLRDEVFASIEDNAIAWPVAILVGACLAMTVVMFTFLFHRGESQDA